MRAVASYIQSFETGIASSKTALGNLIPKIIAEAEEPPLPNDLPLIAELKNRASEARLRIQRRIQECLAEVEALERLKDGAKVDFGNERQAYQNKYDVAVIEQEKHKAIIDENARLTEALELAKKAHQAADRETKNAAGAVQTLENARTTLADRLVRRREILSNAAKKVVGHSSGTLRARTKSDPVPVEYVNSLAALLVGSRISDAGEKCIGWVEEALAANQAGGWKSICDQF